ncbi:MAG: ABC transporter substrate-binding protein [Chlorobi bacterium]|nr:ABC transporter substrate-binding protein [Chlorobiota bacterium]
MCTALGFSACTKQGSMIGTFRPAAGGKQYGGVYRLNEVGEMSSLDPVLINDVTSSHVASNIYDKLVGLNSRLELVPELATSWSVSADGCTYTYHLRTNARFHDNPCFPDGKGRMLTAHDVEYSLNRVCDIRTGTKNFDYFRDKVLGATEYFNATVKGHDTGTEPALPGVRGFAAVDDSTFTITLTRAIAPFENYLALSSMAIHPREAVEYYGKDFFKNPVGTGPFMFVRWEPDRQLVLRRNPYYWDTDEAGNRLPFLDEVRFSFMKDDKLQLLEFAAGNLEESYRIPNEFFADVVDENKRPKGRYSRFTLLHTPAMSTQYYGFLTTDPLFKDVRIRKALNMAVDRRRIIKYVLHGQAAGPAEHGLVPSSMPGYPYKKVQGYSFNPAAARELLAEAGYPNGKGLGPITLQLNSGGGRNVQIAEAIQSMLKENLNITVHLEQVEFAQHLKKIDQGQASFFRLGWVADFPDPETFLNLFYGKLVPKGTGISPINSTRFVNSEFDRIYEQALVTQNREQRMDLYRQAEQVAINNAPMLLIMHDEDYRFLQPYVRDYANNAMDKLMLHRVWFAAQ